jgi:hypothetical protein
MDGRPVMASRLAIQRRNDPGPGPPGIELRGRACGKGGAPMEYRFLGKVIHFFDRISVAVIRLEAELFLEDWVLFEGPHTGLEQQVLSMQIEHEPIESAGPGDEAAVKVDDVVRVGDEVYLIVETEA